MRTKTAERIRRDLEQRGVAPEFSEPISSRLERFTDELTIDTYEAVLSGVAMAYGVHRQDRRDRQGRQDRADRQGRQDRADRQGRQDRADRQGRQDRQETSDGLDPRQSAGSGAAPRRADLADLEEVQRLMGAFAGELSKLEEALETLSAYVTRLRTQTSPPDRTLH